MINLCQKPEAFIMPARQQFHYAINPSFEKTTSYFEDSGMNDEIISLSEVKGEFECFIALDSVYRVTELFYTENNKSVYFQDGSFQVS